MWGELLRRHGAPYLSSWCILMHMHPLLLLSPPHLHLCTVAAHLHVTARVSRWLLPICFLAGVFSYLESTNLNFAALQLNAGLGFAPQVIVTAQAACE